MKHVLAAIVAVVTVILVAIPNAAQETMSVRMDNALLMSEIGAVAQADDTDGRVKLARVLPKQVRPEENRGVDVKQGDEILFLNGQRIRSIDGLREHYQGIEQGEEVKLGVKRDTERFLVGFTKGDGQTGMSQSGGGMRMVVAGGDGGEVELVHELRALLGERDGALTVTAILPEGELEQGDVVTEINGKAVASLAEFRDIYSALELGDAIRLGVRRGGESLDVEAAKAAPPAGMMMRGQQ